MTSASLDRPGRAGRRLRAVLSAAVTVALAAVGSLRSVARPAATHVRDHFYSIAGLGCIDAAAFVHSTFTGLIVTGVSFLVFEWKVSD